MSVRMREIGALTRHRFLRVYQERVNAYGAKILDIPEMYILPVTLQIQQY